MVTGAVCAATADQRLSTAGPRPGQAHEGAAADTAIRAGVNHGASMPPQLMDIVLSAVVPITIRCGTPRRPEPAYSRAHDSRRTR
ncbi:hypothetical protein BJF83_09065 [Nocardiopsis sp. CNR-923]|uniref:hypothetical protein n=1 Tax=Nocardiopsis sp. CNR-923 TaxID=1904965 RepID=UPI00095FB4CD|nr:hypothetical protein [Nocardiopsis sp. CNR-923]OLT30110.1 hypothetical protein BJF83_09065 [Nocardiopsis sp. CNR-923]